MEPWQVQRLRTAWVVAFYGAIGIALLTYGTLAAVATAIAFVGATVLAVVAFVLWLLWGEEPVIVRALLIAPVFIGLAVEIGGLMAVFGLIQ